MADSFTALSRSVSFRPLLLFLESLLLEKTAQTTMVYGKTLNPITLEKGVSPGLISFCKFCYRHGTILRLVDFVGLPQWS